VPKKLRNILKSIVNLTQFHEVFTIFLHSFIAIKGIFNAVELELLSFGTLLVPMFSFDRGKKFLTQHFDPVFFVASAGSRQQKDIVTSTGFATFCLRFSIVQNQNKRLEIDHRVNAWALLL